jgi:hypothetical protein
MELVVCSTMSYAAGSDCIPSSSRQSILLCLKQCGEDFPVAQFVPQFAVEGLDIPVLTGTDWLDEERLYLQAA